MWVTMHGRGCLQGLLLGMSSLWSLAGWAELPSPQPVLKLGACPSGYSANGSYCVPGRQAHGVLEKRGACPAGYAAQGAYCVAGPQARAALLKMGTTCPPGWSSAGEYCLKNQG